MKDIITADLSKFGYREIMLSAELLTAYAKKPVDWLGDDLTLNFNTHSGYVFLSDEDYNVGIMEGKKLVQFFSCTMCGTEGTLSDNPYFEHNGFCSENCEKENEGQ